MRNQPRKIVRTWKKGYFGSVKRKVEEKKLFRKGYCVESEEDVKNFNGGKGLLLGLLFLPLALLGRSKYVRVTYVLEA